MKHRSDLLSTINPENLLFQERFQGLVAKFTSSGMAPNSAKTAALQVIDGSVMGQASILSYMDVFLLIGIVFLICVPFILMIHEEKE
jgi:DHA2 family multidrug resistance protein